MTSVVEAQLNLRNVVDRTHVRIKCTYGLTVHSCGLTVSHCTLLFKVTAQAYKGREIHTRTSGYIVGGNTINNLTKTMIFNL